MTSEKKSSFSVTCSRLSQFLKAKRSLEIPSSPQESTEGSFRPPTTMSLLPGADMSAETKTDTTENFTVTNQKSAKSMNLFRKSFGPADNNNFTKKLEKHQLTIFYKGKVVVFDNFPLEKEKDLMKMASASALAEKLPGYCPQPVQQSPSDLSMPIARRASLHRFFTKRKDRINSKAPYQVNECSSIVGDLNKNQETGPWLGLDPELSNPNPI